MTDILIIPVMQQQHMATRALTACFACRIAAVGRQAGPRELEKRREKTSHLRLDRVKCKAAAAAAAADEEEEEEARQRDRRLK